MRTETGDITQLVVLGGRVLDELVDNHLHLVLAHDLDELTETIIAQYKGLVPN